MKTTKVRLGPEVPAVLPRPGARERTCNDEGRQRNTVTRRACAQEQEQLQAQQQEEPQV